MKQKRKRKPPPTQAELDRIVERDEAIVGLIVILVIMGYGVFYLSTLS